ncbi:MAG: TSCPD domain-containing protein [Clostridia bacterium]|nr:TSCPD domain-containing protein [Clostridia bacterium]
MSKKILSIVLALVLVLFSAAAFADTFEGIGEGFKPLQVKVDVAEGKINAIEMIVNDETPEIGGVAIETLTKQIIDGQTLAVDTIAGATYTTYGFTAAVADAVTKAGLDAAGMGYVDKSVVILPPCMRIKDMLLKNNFHYYNYTTANVCSEYITFAIYEPDMTVWDVRVYGGCHGTSDAFGALCKGLTVDECIERLGGIQCSGSATGVDSCPDQVAQALTAAKGMLTGTLCDGCSIQH